MSTANIERKVIRELQQDIPLTPRPYAEIAKRLGVKERDVLKAIRKLYRERKLRRIGAVLLHRHAGFLANGLAAWKVSPADCDRVGKMIASFPEVTHCYRRKPRRGWPYTIYAMIHATSRRKCTHIVRAIAEKIGITDYLLLFSTREFKKSSPIYQKG